MSSNGPGWRARLAMRRGKRDVFARAGDHIRSKMPVIRNQFNHLTQRLHRDDVHMGRQADNTLAWQKRDHEGNTGRKSPWGDEAPRNLPGRAVQGRETAGDRPARTPAPRREPARPKRQPPRTGRSR